MIKPQCSWSQIKAFNVPHQFWLEKFFHKQKTKSTEQCKQISAQFQPIFEQFSATGAISNDQTSMFMVSNESL